MPSLPFCVVPYELGTITAGNEIAGHDADHLNEFDHVGMTWRTSNNTNIFLKGDFGSAKEVDFAAVLLANAQPGTSWTFGLTDDPTYATFDYTVSGAFINPAITRSDGLYHSHHELPTSRIYRYWYVGISGHTGAFEASALVLGKKVTPSTYYSPGFEFGVEDLGDIELTRWGVPDVAPGLIFRTLAMRFGWLSTSDYETKFRPLVEALGRRKPALWCFDPEATVYRQAKTYFGWLREPPVAIGGNIPGRFEKQFEILSMI